MEVGSITGEPCEGNARPRLWRHVEQKNLRVNYGLNNAGAEKIAARLSHENFKLPVGINAAKTNSLKTVDLQAAIQDYLKVYRAFENIGAYDVINLSCPNAFGGQSFTDPEKLEALLAVIDQHRNRKPLFLKISPDLSFEALESLGRVAEKHRVNGFICSNLTKQHSLGVGGLSGKSVADLSLQQIKHLRGKFGTRFIIIACGGIFSAEDAYVRIRAGASLVQLIAGMIFEGPQLIGEINRGLARQLKQDGWTNIAQAIGQTI
jgi:dihydroorotate dehydrogenase subfamily 2